jgi:NitT/TauT family transport system ATP-binding protein
MPAEAAPPPEIRIEAVAKTFGDGPSAVEAVAPTDLRLSAGSTTALVGPSGCGKSTLLRMVAGLETPSDGAVQIGGESPRMVRRRGALSVAFQDPSLLPWRSVARNVALARHLARQPADPALVADLIARVGLAGFEARRPAELSGGMRQRAAIARCLATQPKILLLDEPFGAVDELTRRRLNLELPPVWDRTGATTLLVTHSVAEAALLSDRVVVLSARPARIVADIPVPLARPRAAAMIETADFAAVARRIEAALFAETSLAAEPGELAAE